MGRQLGFGVFTFFCIFSVFHAKSGTTNTHWNDSSDISNESCELNLKKNFNYKILYKTNLIMGIFEKHTQQKKINILNN